MKGQNVGMLELKIMLAIYKLGARASGMPIADAINNASGKPTVTLGAVYTTLDRLEKQGYITFIWSEPRPVRGGRSTKYSSLTAKGIKETLATWQTIRKLATGIR